MVFLVRALTLLMATFLTRSVAAEETCAKGDPGCDASRHHDKYSEDANKETFEVEAFLKNVDKLTREEERLEALKQALKNHPEEPSLMLALTKEYMAMFDRLHPKMRRIGEVELVQPSIELYMQMLRMPEAKMSNEEHAEIVDHCITNVLGTVNKTASVMVISSGT